MTKGSATFLCGPRLGELARLVAVDLEAPWGVVRRGGLYSEGDEAATYVRLLFRCLARAGLGKHAVVHLPDAGPQLAVHQRRSLERVVLGLRPIALVEVGGQSYPAWLRCLNGALPVDLPPFFEEAGARAALARAAGTGPGPRPSSNSPQLRLLEEHLGRLRPLNLGAGTGSSKPGGALLVGDRPNAQRGRSGAGPAVNWPFVSQVEGGVSSWLSEQLEGVGMPESMLYWVNAYQVGGEPVPLASLYLGLRPQLVVALGKQAAEALTHEGVPHEQVHHPQHWKRFHMDERYRLVQLLARLRTRAAAA